MLSDKTLALGQRIAEELGSQSDRDTLARWMAHDLAEQLQKCEELEGADREAAVRECRETILKLWEHLLNDRQRLPVFNELDKVVRSLASLDLANPRYFRQYRSTHPDNEQNSESDKWLRIAEGLDYSAQILIGFAISNAVREASTQESADWLRDASEAGLLSSDFGRALEIVCPDSDGESQKISERQKALEDRIERLEGFVKMSEALAVDLRSELARLPVEKSDG